MACEQIRSLNAPMRLFRFSAFIFLIGGCMNPAQGGQAPTGPGADAQVGRDFRSLSVSPDGEELFFVEVDERLPEHSRVLRYDLKQNTLRHYALPKGYAYTDAKLSPSGKYLVMKRVAEVPENDDAKVRESLSNPELVIMQADGTDFRVLDLGHGFKHGPIISNDDGKVAYWRGALRPPHSKSLASRLDIWEVDLKTGTDVPFAGHHEFFEGGQMHYLPGDGEIIFQAYGPRAFARSMSAYEKKYNSSNTYRVRREQTSLPEPILTEVSYAMFPMMDLAGRLYFQGQHENKISFFVKSPGGEIRQWAIRFANIAGVTVAPAGTYMAFIYPSSASRPSHEKSGIGMLDTQTSQWRTLRIPPLGSSVSIAVKPAR